MIGAFIHCIALLLLQSSKIKGTAVNDPDADHAAISATVTAMQAAEDVIGILRQNDKLIGRGKPRPHIRPKASLLARLVKKIMPFKRRHGATNVGHLSRLRAGVDVAVEAKAAPRLRDRGKFA